MTPKLYTTGTHRTASLGATRAKLEPFLKPMGITRISTITGLDNIGIPVVVVCRPNSRSLAVAQGKGPCLLSAQVSGLMESVEFYHAENISNLLLFGSFSQLRYTHTLLSPGLLPRSAVDRFHTELKLHWVRGVDLNQERECWVPLELVHTDFTHPLPADSGCFPMTSNGLASGNHAFEAIVHGITEVIERDSEALFWLQTAAVQQTRRVLLATIDDELCRHLLDQFDQADVRVAVWDTTTDLGVPSFRAVIMDSQLNAERPLRPSLGSGCHTSKNIALSRALTEAAQSRLTVISSSRDDLPRQRFSEASDTQRLGELRREAMPGSEQRDFRAVPTYEADHVEEDLLWLKARLSAQGIEHLVTVDLTKPEFGIPVFRVLIPELEAMHGVPGWTPGARASQLLARAAQ